MVQIASYGPWAVVTGASSGIGRAFAAHLAAAGLDLVLAARSTDRMAELGSALSAAHGVRHRVVGVDLSRPGAAAELLAATADLDVGLLVSNAGTARTGPFLDQPVDELHRRLTLNAAAHLDLVHAFGRRFVDRGRGGVLLVSALGAQHGWENMAHDGGAKAYLHSLGEALHHELKPAGVAVTVMLPGNVDTPVLDELGIERSGRCRPRRPCGRPWRRSCAVAPGSSRTVGCAPSPGSCPARSCAGCGPGCSPRARGPWRPGRPEGRGARTVGGGCPTRWSPGVSIR